MNVVTAPNVRGLQVAGSRRFIRALPALAALAYPGLIWCGPAIAPVFLAVSLGVPLVALFVAHGLDHRVYPRSRWIAFAAVGAPPLYSLLGGWLDFQHVLPFKGLHVWVLLWVACACIAFRERPAVASVQPVEQRRRLAFAHGVSAAVITCFAAAHLTNHFAGLWGGERHTAIMHALRFAYRAPIVEIALIASITFQVLSGVRLLKRKLPQAINWIDSLQVASGIYLALFFLAHVSAVFRARYLRHTDTNWTWASDGLLTDPWSARLTPYYFLAVIALGIHGGAGVRKVMLNHGRPIHLADNAFYVTAAGAAVLSGAIMTGLFRG